MSKINLSFAGCGFLGIYHVGVAACFREYAPQALVTKIAGASVGSIAAAALLCDVSLGQTTTDIISVGLKARENYLGPFSSRFKLNDILKERLTSSLPPDAYQICSGRLLISVTRRGDLKNVLLSQFDSNQELVQALLCSCFIPFYSGFNIPKYRGVQYFDGGFSDNLPVLDSNTVTVSPFSGEHDICPQDESCNILQVNISNTSIAFTRANIYRLICILLPPKPEVLSKMCQQGFDDALRYLQRKSIISCTRCLGVRSVVKIQHNSEKSNCNDCKRKRLDAKGGVLPKKVVTAIESSADAINASIFSWLYNNTYLSYVLLLGFPQIVTYDISVSVFLKVWQYLLESRQNIEDKFEDIIDLAKRLISHIESRGTTYKALFSCELSITEFNYAKDQCKSVQSGYPFETSSVKIEDERAPRRKFSIKRAMSAQVVSPTIDQRQQRKSYAGFPNSNPQPEVSQMRRKSLSEVIQPERVIKNMKFGFTVGVSPGLSSHDKHADLFQSLKSLGEEDNELNIMELAKTAINMEHQYMHAHCANADSKDRDSLGNALTVSDSDPLMSYCYMDEDKSIKIQEIYNVTDADSSFVLSDEERQLNSELQWENNWINPSEFKSIHNKSIVDSLDDHEFDYSDSECDITDSDYSPVKDEMVEESARVEAVSRKQRKMAIAVTNIEGLDLTKPHRKTSFVIMDKEETDIKQPHRKSSFVIVK